MIILNTLFETLADFQECVPGVSSDTLLDELNSSAVSARKQIQNILTPEIWKKILDDKDSDIHFYLQVAFGNLTMDKAAIFNVLSKRMSGGGEIYKHELETVRRQYIDNYYNAMDSLIQELETNNGYISYWQATPEYKLQDQLQIKTASEFNSLYGIDMSYLFFFRTMAIQREVLDDIVSEYFVRIQDRKSDFEVKLKRALAMFVISIAIIRFDITELPVTIRSLFNEQKSSRHGTAENTIMQNLAASLSQKALEIIKTIDLALSESSSENIDSETSFNRESDKFFLMS